MTFCFGTETEMALVVHARGVIGPGPSEVAQAVVDEIGRRHRHVPSPPPDRRLFLANGGCIYADLGGHPEIATAECCHPMDLAAQTVALRRMVAEAVEAVGRTYETDIRAVANNIDYGFSGGQTYGHHLNVLINGVTREQVATQLAPLLVAMPVIAGTGSLSLGAGCNGFELSQRARYMRGLIGRHTTHSREMITLNDEPLSSSGLRLHMICFDTPMSTYQLALVPAVIAITVKAIESGADIAGPVALSEPVVKHLQTVSRDCSLSAELPLARGGAITALGIHEHYIRRIEDFLNNRHVPDWTFQMLRLWSEVVERLGSDPFLEANRLDWVMKLALFTSRLTRHGLSWADVSKWSYILSAVRHLKATGRRLNLGEEDDHDSPAYRTVRGLLNTYLEKNDLSWEDFPALWNASNHLCQQCLDYHSVTTDSVRQVHGSDALAPLVTSEMVETAKTSAPTGTRAAIRGEAIRNARPGATADWTSVHNGTDTLIMADALGEGASWQKGAERTEGDTVNDAREDRGWNL